MGEENLIDLQGNFLKGNVLDIGGENYGIIYNLFKNSNEGEKEVSIDYVEGVEEKEAIEKNYYDNVVMFFYISSIWRENTKKKIIEDIYSFLKDKGELHIWDIDKKHKKIVNDKIKVILPENKIKEFSVKDFNLMHKSSLENVKSLIDTYFNIIEIKQYNDLYYIRATKKEEVQYENIISGNKFKVYTQQFSSKIFKDLHQRFKLSLPDKRGNHK